MTENNQGKILYLDAASGISGDMTVAALLDLGADQKVLEKVLESIPVGGFRIKVSRVRKASLDCCDFAVQMAPELENHDHDMAYLFPDRQGQDGSQQHAGEQGHAGEQEHLRDPDHAGGTAHVHRTFSEVCDILSEVRMTDHARALAEKIFRILAEAEAAAHGVSPEKVHFHEVGAVDSIVDITAAAVCLDNLGITEAVIPFLYEGTGTVRTQHGILPVPVPAVVHIAEKYHLPLSVGADKGEYVTPTGAAIAAAIVTSFHLPEKFRILKTGTGAGKREYERPGILRAFLIDTEKIDTEKKDLAEEYTDSVWKLECNIDDSTGEALGYAMERLFAAGARDVHYHPVFMKTG